MKTFFILFLFSASAFACKPMPLTLCVEPSVKIDHGKFKELSRLVTEYFKVVDKHIKNPKRRSSCFNNHFAAFYLFEMKNALVAQKELTCMEQAEVVKGHVKNLNDLIKYVPSKKAALQVQYTQIMTKMGEVFPKVL